jgi:hypothetical protein
VESEHQQTAAITASRSDIEGAPAESSSIDKQLMELRSQIRDVGYEIDLYKASVAGSMGGGIFLLLLAGGAGYDLVTGKEGIWSPMGVTHNLLLFIAWALGVAGAALLIQGFLRHRRRDLEREARLAELQQQYALLLDRKEIISEDHI